ncbi:MAG: MarR family transcriptional regulator [Solirubrobacterales bacterium]|nr:MarR family transcriptional regulator [Solirubrobacterales bacterium]
MQATSAPAKVTLPQATMPAEDLAHDLYALVTYLHKSCQADVFEAVGALDLTMTQIKVLHHLEQTERSVTVKEAAELVGISLPAASRAVDDLVRRGFAERHEDLADRRMKRVNITDRGRAAIRRLNAARFSGLEEFADALTAAQRARLSAALTKLLERPDIAACRLEDR